MFIELLEKELNKKLAENGAEGYITTGKALVDFNFQLPSYRDDTNYNKMLAQFAKAFAEDKELALKYLFYLRDIREGIGERDIFRKCIRQITPYLDDKVFDWIVEYGRWDDLFTFIGTNLEDSMALYVSKQLFEDKKNMKDGKRISLLAKWMPSINTSSKDTRRIAKWFIQKMSLNASTYRKTLSTLREYIDVIERKTCANEWNKINYSTVSSNANLKYKNAFLKHDKERREEYLNSLKTNDSNVKINCKVLFPHNIVSNYRYVHSGWNPCVIDYDETLEQLWKNLPNYVDSKSNILVVRDGSGSMTNLIPGSNTTALDVATGLSIYFSEKLEGEFYNKFITFSSKPEFVNLGKLNTLRDKLIECYNYDDCSNTNIEKTFDLILNVAIKNNLKQEEIPNLLIISDMEFDYSTCNPNNYSQNKLFEILKAKFKEHNYKLPKLIFWNVNSRTNTIPLVQNELGVILVSGFSPAVTNLVLSNELDPYKALVKELMKERYSKITLN